jgi:hypothetical protein
MASIVMHRYLVPLAGVAAALALGLALPACGSGDDDGGGGGTGGTTTSTTTDHGSPLTRPETTPTTFEQSP